MRLQSLAGNRDLELPTIFDLFNLDAANIGDAIGDLLGQSKAISEIFEIVWCCHHDGEGCAAYDDLYRRFNRDRPTELRPARARIVGKGPDWYVDRTWALTRPHRPRLSRSDATRPPLPDRATASRRNGWSAAPARPSPYIPGSWSPNPSTRLSPRSRRSPHGGKSYRRPPAARARLSLRAGKSRPCGSSAPQDRRRARHAVRRRKDGSRARPRYARQCLRCAASERPHCIATRCGPSSAEAGSGVRRALRWRQTRSA